MSQKPSYGPSVPAYAEEPRTNKQRREALVERGYVEGCVYINQGAPLTGRVRQYLPGGGYTDWIYNKKWARNNSK